VKISDLTVVKVAHWCRIDLPDESDEFYKVITDEVQMCMDSVISFMCKRTARTEEYIKDQDDLTYTFLGLCAEEFENRQHRMSRGQYKNEFLMDVLDAHSINLIPGEADLVGDDNA